MRCGPGGTIPFLMKTLDIPETVIGGTFWATLLFLAFVPTLHSTLSPQICPPRPHSLPAFPSPPPPLPPRTGLVPDTQAPRTTMTKPTNLAALNGGMGSLTALEAGSLKSGCRQGHTLTPPLQGSPSLASSSELLVGCWLSLAFFGCGWISPPLIPNSRGLPARPSSQSRLHMRPPPHSSLTSP